jgi:hypothetical protein
MTYVGDAFWEAAGQEWWVEPVSVVEYRCAPEWHVRPRAIGDYMLWYGQGGVAALTMAGQQYPLLPGDMIFIPPGVVHSAVHDPAHPLCTITAHFTFRDATGTALCPAPEALPPPRCATREPHVFDTYFSRLLTLAALRMPGWQAVARALLLVPLAKPALATLGVFTFVASWNDFITPLIYLSTPEHMTLTVGLSYFQGQYNTQWNLMMAATLISVVPIVILYAVAQKYFIQGIAMTGLKG